METAPRRPAWPVLNTGMSRRKSSLLFSAVVGAMSLAEAVAVVLVAQVDWHAAEPVVVAVVLIALLLWTVLLAAALVTCAQHLLIAGVGASYARFEEARMSAHRTLLSAAPTVELLGRALRRQEAPLGELRDALLACAVAGGPRTAAATGARLARAAGVAAGLQRMNQDTLRMAAVLEDWVDVARSRQDEVRGRADELREHLETLPAPVATTEESADPVFGYGLAASAPAAADDVWANLPEALRQRLRGQSSRWNDAGDAEPDWN